MANPKIRYDIEAAIKGSQDAEGLAKTLRDLGDVLEGDLQQGAQGAAQALEALGAKQRALEAFKTLGLETRGLSEDFRKAQSGAKQLGDQLQPVSQAARALAAAENDAKAALDASRAAVDTKRAALKALRDETDTAGRKTQEYKLAQDGLKAAIAAGKAELAQRKEALRQASVEAQKAARAEAALRQEYGMAVASVRDVSRALDAKRAALSEASAQMNRLGVATSNLGVHQRNLQNAVQQVRQEVERMAPAYQQAASKASAATLQQAAATRTLRDGVGELGAQLQRIQSIAMVALGGSWLAGKAKEVADVADAFKNLQARVQLATGEGAVFEAAWERISRIALDTNTSLEGTATLFARVADAGKSAGLSAEAASKQSYGLVQTINQAIQLSGASAQASDAAITQLIQGLQSGVLRGEEFNSVMEQAPRLAKALADGLGVTTGELRKMAGQGALTTEVVIKALQGQADVVEKEFEKLPATVGRALQNLSTQWTLYVGSADAGLLSSENAAKAIDFLAQNLDTLVNTLQTAGKLWAAIKIAQLAGDFGAWASKTLTATAAVEANTVATAANTAVQKANAAAVGASATAMGAQAVAAKASAAAQLTAAEQAKVAAIFGAQASKAQQSANAVLAAGGAAAGRAAGGMGLLGTAVRGATTLLGGPVGLIATVVLFNQEIKGAIQSVVEWGMGFTEAGRKLKAFEEEQRRSEVAARAQKVAADEAATAAQRLAAAQEKARNASFGLTKQGETLIAKFDGMVKGGEKVDDALGKIGKEFDLSNQMGVKTAASVLDKLAADGKITADQFAAAWQAASQSIDLGELEVNARAALSGSAREAEQLAQVMDAVVRQAVDRTGLDFDVLRGRIGATSRSAINDVDAIALGFDRLKEQGVDAAAALQTRLSQAINTADSQKSIDVLRGKVEELRKQLGDKVADGLLDAATVKAKDLKRALEDATPGIQGVGKALRRLGVVSDESLREIADGAKAAFDEVRRSGTASTREVSESFRVAAEAAIKANKGIAPFWVSAQAGAQGYEVVVDKAGKATLRLKEATDRSADSHDRAARSIRGHVAELERLNAQKEREIAAQEKANQLKERELELYRQKWGIDKEGYSLNTAGQRQSMSTLSRTAVLQMAKQQGLDDVNALRVVDSFGDQYDRNPGLLGGIQGGVSADAVNKAIADAVLAQTRSKATAGSGAVQTSLPSLQAGVVQPIGQTHRHEIVINGSSLGVVPTDSEGDATLNRFMSELQKAKLKSGY